ncbi:hypothetical protein T05_9514 [Trichinella murrelli]|uniref:Uncharacterized protein n=1 Tax=Trichinella murrelli TaxID=144512 RepID=A0A0V0U0Y3_9BILA|nr:hypothetical protein T05_9514 [Trichinella murrelli]
MLLKRNSRVFIFPEKWTGYLQHYEGTLKNQKYGHLDTLCETRWDISISHNLLRSGMTAAPPRKQSSYEMQYCSFVGEEWRSKSGECFCVILEAAEKLYSDLIPLPRNISRQMNRSIDPK